MLKNLLLWIVAIALATGAATTALGAIAKNRSPDLALTLFPGNGFAAEAAAAGLTRVHVAENRGEFPDRLDRSLAVLAVQAFESEPVTADAIAVIALSRTGDVRRQMMHKAFELSRRQQLVTGWMIIDSGRRNNIPAILDYYDTTLRTSSKVAGVIIPVMANALANEDFVEPFAKLLSRDPIWASRFWQHVVKTPDALVNASQLRKIMENNSDAKGGYQDPSLIYALVREGQFDEAQTLYKLLTSERRLGSDLISNSNFKLSSRYPPFDWQLFSTGEYGAAISQNSMVLSAINNAGGLMARQLVSLPKDALTLEIESIGSVPTEANVYVEFVCAEKSQTNSRAIKIPLSGKLTEQKIDNVQGSCTYHWINIFGRPSRSIEGFDITITKFNIDD